VVHRSRVDFFVVIACAVISAMIDFVAAIRSPLLATFATAIASTSTAGALRKHRVDREPSVALCIEAPHHVSY
jgi:predicted PurR-regulated permease PerM